MIFGNRRIYFDIDVRIRHNQITRVSKTKFIGVLLDEKLTWKDQINNADTKLSRINGVLYKASHIFRNYRLAYHLSLIVLTCIVLLL
ncbi:hypothetical protein NP493_545g01103 [Ridgeia piscesae]|uniref:Uncharacterized protein n=1 Tax=Ridgeia piscesae TaxID=27915 RepID=A0AAD9NT43_RIDPI|nr:hypothetical protein NP493_545g01103 [Ridgeia piscesae]